MQEFSIKTNVCFGSEPLKKLSEYKADCAVVFTDNFMRKSGTADKVASYLSGCTKVAIFSDIKPDPPVEVVASALKFLLDNNATVAVALGGGSSIDAAKSTVMIAEKQLGIKIPFIAIPTTSGTGSEVTKFSVITDSQKGVKYPLVSDDLLPDVAIMCPELTLSVPSQITADTGFDVITHALEAYVSTAANDYADALCEKALELAFKYLPVCCKNPGDVVAREKMQTASCLAGMAFNAVSLGVVHGIAHALGANFHIPHGRANAMMLPHVMAFNAGFLDASLNEDTCKYVQSRFAKIAKIAGLSSFSEASGARNLINHILTQENALGIPLSLGEAGVTRENYDAVKMHIVSSAVKDACTATNPRKISANNVELILKNVDKF